LKPAHLGLAVALAAALVGAATAQIAILQIQILDGEGAVHGPGSHAIRFLTVAVTDETGRPVQGAAVTFHLPEDGPSGVFPNGLRTQIAISDARGHATLPGLTLNQTPGRFPVRIFAVKEQARAGLVSFQYIAEPNSGAAKAQAGSTSHRTRWIAMAALAGGGAAAGFLSRRSGSPAAAPNAPVTPAGTPVSLGTPTVTVGAP
jgi:hypothetical protein